MSGAHPDIGPELRRLAQTILDRLDPAVGLAAAASAAEGTGRCEQVWCPVCALAAAINGEHHPLLGVIAEHSAALLAVIRALLDDAADPDPDPDCGPPGDSPPAAPGRYQHIPVTVED